MLKRSHGEATHTAIEEGNPRTHLCPLVHTNLTLGTNSFLTPPMPSPQGQNIN